MHSSSWPLPRLGALGFPCYVFQWLSFQERGWVVLCFHHGLCGEVSGPSLAPRFAGFTVPAQPTRDNRNGRLLYPARAVRCSWSAWAVHRQRCEPFLLPQVVASRRDRRSRSPSGSGCRGHGGAGSRSRNGLFCLPWARCTRAVAPSLLCEELAVILVDVFFFFFFFMNGNTERAKCVDVALALILARLLLRGCCPLVPRNLPPVLCGGGAGPGLTRTCSPGHITASDLETGPWALLPRSSPAICRLHWLAQLGVRVCLHILKCRLYYFLEILDSISSESLVPS